jgi:hypothetical protein
MNFLRRLISWLQSPAEQPPELVKHTIVDQQDVGYCQVKFHLKDGSVIEGSSFEGTLEFSSLITYYSPMYKQYIHSRWQKTILVPAIDLANEYIESLKKDQLIQVKDTVYFNMDLIRSISVEQRSCIKKIEETIYLPAGEAVSLNGNPYKLV